jgi:uncharacterized membrane protein
LCSLFGYPAARERLPERTNAGNQNGHYQIKPQHMSVLTATAPPGALPDSTAATRTYRVGSIDLLRGLVMIIMALDHTRDFFHQTAMTDDPLNLATTTPWLFLTRWITHFCAPVFVFLAGTSIYLQSLRKTTKELSVYLLTRGIWLIFVEVVIINFAFSFDAGFSLVALQTIWSIAISMIILSVVIWLPFRLILVLAALIVLGHNSLDFYESGKQGGFSFLYDLVHHPGFFPLDDKHNLLIMYPFLPWAGLMMAGYCFGKLFQSYEGAKRRMVLTWTGIGIIAFFIILRATNMYGNPESWSQQKNLGYTVLSFIDTHKYPPSLLYMCMTIGPAIIFLAWMDGIRNRLTNFITVYGRVPFLYYVLHFYLIHLLAMVFFALRGHSISSGWSNPPQNAPKFVIPGDGYSLLTVYGIWLMVVLMLYPVCKWFSEYKKTHRQWWLGYL